VSRPVTKVTYLRACHEVQVLGPVDVGLANNLVFRVFFQVKMAETGFSDQEIQEGSQKNAR